MNKDILNTGVQSFIEKYLNTDIVSVLLQKQVFATLTQKELVQQLEAKKKCKTKLPTWFNTPQIYYPPKLHIEQSSSEPTAAYKATLTRGKTIVDLTGGLGVDSYFFSKEFEAVIHCETNAELSEIAQHNFDVLGVNNICFKSKDGIAFLLENEEVFDWVYVDPSRRSDTKGKVFLLEDCTPNILEHLPSLFQKTNHILIKTSPLLDLQKGIEAFKTVREIHVVAVKNEVKEILWILQKEPAEVIPISAVNISNTSSTSFVFNWKDEKQLTPQLGKIETFLYEPNAAILKAGGFQSVATQHNLVKLHQHTHLYTSTKAIPFPGRCFRVEEVLPCSKKALARFKKSKANITTRNFPHSVAYIREKYQIRDGGEVFLFFCKDYQEKLVCIQASKTSN